MNKPKCQWCGGELSLYRKGHYESIYHCPSCDNPSEICGAIIHVGFEGATTCANPKVGCIMHDPVARQEAQKELDEFLAGAEKAGEILERRERLGRGGGHECFCHVPDSNFAVEHCRDCKDRVTEPSKPSEELEIFDWEKAIDHSFRAWKIDSRGLLNDVKATVRIALGISKPPEPKQGWEGRFDDLDFGVSYLGEKSQFLLKGFIKEVEREAYGRGWGEGYAEGTAPERLWIKDDLDKARTEAIKECVEKVKGIRRFEGKEGFDMWQAALDAVETDLHTLLSKPSTG